MSGMHDQEANIPAWLKKVKGVGSETAFTDEEATLYYNTLMGNVQEGASVLEIGCQYGRSTCVMVEAAQQNDLQVYLCDSYMQECSVEAAKSLIEMLVSTKVYFVLYRMASMYYSNTRRHGLILIDGDHSYQGVKQDIIVARRNMTNGGILCFHDYQRPGLPDVTRAVDEYLATYKPEWVKQAGSLLVVKEVWCD